MRTPKIAVASLVIGTLLGVCCLWQSPHAVSRASAEESPASNLKTLYAERTAVLNRMFEEVTQSHKNATASLEQVHQAHMALMKAELDQAESGQDRIAILDKIFDLAKKREQGARSMFEKGAMSHSQLNQAKVDRLNAEIALIRAKAG